MELSDDYFGGRAAFRSARGMPFFLWLDMVAENEALGEESLGLKLAITAKKIKDFLENAEIQAKLETDIYVRDLALHADAVAANVRAGAGLNRVPEAPAAEVVHSKFGYVLLRRGKLTDEEILRDPGRLKVADAEIVKDFSRREGNALAEEFKAYLEAGKGKAKKNTPHPAGQTAAPSALSPKGRGKLREAYFPLPDEHTARCEAAGRAVCRGLGLSAAEIEKRTVVTLWPFARGEYNAEVAAQSRWGVLTYIELSGEVHHQLRNQILSDAVLNPLPAWEPKKGWEKSDA